MKLDENIQAAFAGACQDTHGDKDYLSAYNKELKTIRLTFFEVANISLEQDAYEAEVDSTVIKMMTFNERTKRVKAYKTVSLKVNWPKTIPSVAVAVIAIVGTSASFIGFIGAMLCFHNFVKELGVELTTTEALVFSTVYDNRNEYLWVEESELEQLCTSVANLNSLPAPSKAQVAKGLDQLKILGIVSLDDGKITLEDEWIYRGNYC